KKMTDKDIFKLFHQKLLSYINFWNVELRFIHYLDHFIIPHANQRFYFENHGILSLISMQALATLMMFLITMCVFNGLLVHYLIMLLFWLDSIYFQFVLYRPTPLALVLVKQVLHQKSKLKRIKFFFASRCQANGGSSHSVEYVRMRFSQFLFVIRYFVVFVWF